MDARARRVEGLGGVFFAAFSFLVFTFWFWVVFGFFLGWFCDVVETNKKLITLMYSNNPTF